MSFLDEDGWFSKHPTSLYKTRTSKGFLEAMAAVKEAEGAVASYEGNLKASNMKPFGGRGCGGGAGDEKKNVGWRFWSFFFFFWEINWGEFALQNALFGVGGYDDPCFFVGLFDTGWEFSESPRDSTYTRVISAMFFCRKKNPSDMDPFFWTISQPSKATWLNFWGLLIFRRKKCQVQAFISWSFRWSRA